jgi:hypothetical protein
MKSTKKKKVDKKSSGKTTRKKAVKKKVVKKKNVKMKKAVKKAVKKKIKLKKRVNKRKEKTMSSEDKKKNGTGGAGIENLDKVRDILFGAQIQDVDKRFSKLEDLLHKETRNISDETNKRLSSLENYIKKEMEALTNQLGSEKDERDGADRDLGEKIKDVDKKVAQLKTETAGSQRDLNKQILDQSKTLRDEVQKTSRELTAAFDKAMKELQDRKTDRTALAALLQEMAMRLNKELDIKLKK